MTKAKGTDSIGIKAWLQDLTYNEVHLFIMGLYRGFIAVTPTPGAEPKQAQKDRLKWDVNRWYWESGYIFGYIVKAGLLGVSVKSGVVQSLIGL